jgi:hypothetical protein
LRRECHRGPAVDKEKTRPKPGFLVSALHAGVAAGPGAARAARTTLSWSAWP